MKLKSCPFCGGKAVYRKSYIVCGKCGAMQATGQGTLKQLRKTQTAKWNRRAASAGRPIVSYVCTWEREAT